MSVRKYKKCVNRESTIKEFLEKTEKARKECEKQFSDVKPSKFKDEEVSFPCGSFDDHMEDATWENYCVMEKQYTSVVSVCLSEMLENNPDINWLVISTKNTSRLFLKERFSKILKLYDDQRFIFTFDKNELFLGKASKEDCDTFYSLRGIQNGELGFKMNSKSMLEMIRKLMKIKYCWFDFRELKSVVIRESGEHRMLILTFDAGN